MISSRGCVCVRAACLCLLVQVQTIPSQRGDGPATIAKLKIIVQNTANATLVESAPDYLYAQYATSLMKYVDDVEFWFDPASNSIAVRSASRLGQRDLDANRKRIEAVRAALAAAP